MTTGAHAMTEASAGATGRTGIISNGDIVEAVRSGLTRAFEHSANPARELADRTGRNLEATRNWLEGRNAPRAAELADLCRQFDEVFEEFCRLVGRMPPEQKQSQGERLLEDIGLQLNDYLRGKVPEKLK